MPTTTTSLKSSELTPDPKFKVFMDIFAHPKTATTPITAAGSANQELFQNYVVKWQAGKVPDLQGGLAEVDKQIDAQLAQSAGTQALAVSATPLAPGGPAPRLQARDRRAARRRARVAAAAARCSALMSPWIVGFTVFFGYPLLASVYLSFTHYDLLSRPRWVGTANYRVHAPPRPADLDRGARTRCG